MKVKQLIEELQKMPPEAEVAHIWDGAARTYIEFVWLSKAGGVMTADYYQVVYRDEDRPKDAPLAINEPYWRSAHSLIDRDE